MQKWKQRKIQKKATKRKWYIRISFFVILLFSILQWFEWKIQPMVRVIAEYECRTAVLDIMNEVIEDNMNTRFLAQDFLREVKNQAGQLQAIELNTGKLNEIRAEIAKEISQKLAQTPIRELRIPVGTLLNWQILSGRGPQLTVKMIPNAYVQSSVDDKFISEGINQTQYQVWIRFETQVNIAMAGYTIPISVTSEVRVAQTTILGTVPQIYAAGRTSA